MKSLKAVIFDLDGTLVDTIPFHSQSFFELFSDLNHPVPMRRIRPLIRHPTEKIFEKLHARKRLGMDIEKLLELRRKKYYELIRGKKIVFSDAYPALLELHRYKKGIATNSSRQTLEASTNQRLLRFFKSTITFSDVLRAKPNPEMLNKISRKLRVKPSECAFIGDSVMDIRSAKNAGMTSIGLYRKTGASTLADLDRKSTRLNSSH